MTPPIDPYADDDDFVDDPFGSIEPDEAPEPESGFYDPYSDPAPPTSPEPPPAPEGGREPPQETHGLVGPQPDPELDTAAAKPRIIATDMEEEVTGWEYDEADFGDITPQQVRFTAPAAEDVFTTTPRPTDDAADVQEDVPVARSDKKAAAKADKLARKQQAAAQREQRKAERREEKRRQAEFRRNERAERKGKIPEAAQDVDLDDEPKNHSTGKALLGLGAAALLVIGAAFASDALRGDSDSEDATAVADTSEVSAEPEESDQEAAVPTETSASVEGALTKTVSDRCKPRQDGVVVSNADGDGSTPESAIEGFNYAYYTLADAAAATKFLDRKMYESVEGLQKGIDDPQNGDAYCLEIAKGKDPDQFNVGLIEFTEPKSADSDVVSWRTNQTITTEKQGERWVIVSLTNEASA